MTGRYRVQVLAGVAAVTFLADLAAKWVAVRTLAGKPAVILLGGLVRLQYVENKGAFLSLGATLSPTLRAVIFILAVMVILVAMSVYVLRGAGVAKAELWAASLFVGGGLGNLVDRLALGYVRDFAVLGVGQVRTGVINLADVAITAGAVLLFTHMFRSRKRKGSGA